MDAEMLAMLTPAERAAWERAEAATEGPWEPVVTTQGWYDRHAGRLCVAEVQMLGSIIDADPEAMDVVSHPEAKMAEPRDDAEFIAAARTDLPAALQALAEARRDVAALRQVLGLDEGPLSPRAEKVWEEWAGMAVPTLTVGEALRALHEAGHSGWDRVKDVQGAVQELRAGGDPFRSVATDAEVGTDGR